MPSNSSKRTYSQRKAPTNDSGSDGDSSPSSDSRQKRVRWNNTEVAQFAVDEAEQDPESDTDGSEPEKVCMAYVDHITYLMHCM